GYDLYDLPTRDVWGNLDPDRPGVSTYYGGMLSDARVPFVLLAAGTVLVLYLLAQQLGGTLAGVAAAAFALGSPLAREHLVEAKPESPLAFSLCLTLLLCVLAARHGRTARLSLRWA